MWVRERVRPREGGVRGRKRGRGMEVLKIIGNETVQEMENAVSFAYSILFVLCMVLKHETMHNKLQIRIVSVEE